jgi:two-component system sensor histidine kinase BarA
LTAHVVGEGATAWKSAGMDGVLPKPFRMEAMAACLAESLSGAPAADMQATPPSAADLPMTAGESDTGPLFDPDTLAQMAAMAAIAGVDAARRIYGLFAEHAPPGLVQLLDAVAGQDAARIAGAAHAIKSMSLSIGASALAGALSEVELGARERGAIPSQGIVQDIEALLRDTLSAVEGLPFLRDAQAATDATLDQKTA